jgi:hypothetical protein
MKKLTVVDHSFHLAHYPELSRPPLVSIGEHGLAPQREARVRERKGGRH